MVDVAITSDGDPMPLSIRWADGRVFKVDRVSDPAMRKRCEKTGGYAFRYTVTIRGKKRFLWRNERGWFVEVPANGAHTRDPRIGCIPE